MNAVVSCDDYGRSAFFPLGATTFILEHQRLLEMWSSTPAAARLESPLHDFQAGESKGMKSSTSSVIEGTQSSDLVQEYQYSNSLGECLSDIDSMVMTRSHDPEKTYSLPVCKVGYSWKLATSATNLSFCQYCWILIYNICVSMTKEWSCRRKSK